MKKYITLFNIIFVTVTFAQNHNTFLDEDTLDVNNVWLRSSNVGQCHYAFWQLLDNDFFNQFIVFDHGPWLLGKVGEDTVLSISQWFSSYSPGPIINGQPAMLIHPEDSLRYRVYNVSKGDDSTNIDYAEWPVDFGAPVDDEGNPLILGDQTLWAAFNSLDSTVTNSIWWQEDLQPFPVEFHQTVFAREGMENDEQDIFANTVFIEWEIINKGNQQIDSAIFGFWTDIDFDDTFENRPGADTMRQSGYCWSDNIITPYDSIPPAVGYCFLYGPVVPSIGSTAIFKGRPLNNYKNLQLTSFRGIGDDAWPGLIYSPARSLRTAWNIARGFDSQGDLIIDPTTNTPTKFPLSGDPVTGNGWTFNSETGGGAGFVFFSGPFTLAPSDTQWAMVALIPAKGESNLNSITQLRKKAEILLSLPYDSLAFGSVHYPITDVKDNQNLNYPSEYILSQNYPNPFNPNTKINYILPQAGYVNLTVYDLLGKEVEVLKNEEQKAGKYEVNFRGRNLASGVYFFTLRVNDFIKTKKMVFMK